MDISVDKKHLGLVKLPEDNSASIDSNRIYISRPVDLLMSPEWDAGKEFEGLELFYDPSVDRAYYLRQADTEQDHLAVEVSGSVLYAKEDTDKIIRSSTRVGLGQTLKLEDLRKYKRIVELGQVDSKLLTSESELLLLDTRDPGAGINYLRRLGLVQFNTEPIDPSSLTKLAANSKGLGEQHRLRLMHAQLIQLGCKTQLLKQDLQQQIIANKIADISQEAGSTYKVTQTGPLNLDIITSLADKTKVFKKLAEDNGVSYTELIEDAILVSNQGSDPKFIEWVRNFAGTQGVGISKPQLVEVTPPVEKPEKIDFESILPVKPISKSELREIIKKRKTGELTLDSSTTTRDIIEYAYIRNMTYLIELSCRELLKHKREDFDQPAVAEKIEGIIDQFAQEYLFSAIQKEKFLAAKDKLIAGIVKFDKEIADGFDIAANLGPRFEGVPREHLNIDSSSYPGAVIVLVENAESYKKIRGGKVSKGFYNRIFGQRAVKGRVIVVNKGEAHQNTANHEYFHFLYSQLAEDLQIIPETTGEVKTSTSELEIEFERLDAEIRRLKERRVTDLQYQGKVSSDTREKLSARISEWNAALVEQEDYEFMQAARISTYPRGEIRELFDKFRNEFYAYAFGGNRNLIGEVSTLPAPYFGDTLRPAIDHPRFKAIYGQIMKIFDFSLRVAYEKGMKPNQIAGVILGSRNFEQVIKNIQIHTALTTANSQTVSKVETQADTQAAPVQPDTRPEAIAA